MKSVKVLAIFVLNAVLLSAIADPQWDPNAPIKPLPVPDKPDREKASYALGMSLGLERIKAKSDTDVEAFTKGLEDIYHDKPTEFPYTDLMKYVNVVRTKGEKASPQEKRQFAYAMGMRFGTTLKESSTDCDTSVLVAAIKDVTEGKPTKMKESEVEPLLEQGRQYGLYMQGASNRVAGAAFLEKVSKEPGVKKLADGLYYKVIKEGSGRECKTLNDAEEVLFIRWKASFLDGREIDHHNRYPKSLYGGWPAWTLAVKQMKLGDKWQVYSAPQYSYGRDGDPALKVGPDSTIIWDLEIREFVKNGDPRLGTGRLGHGIGGRDNDDDLKELGKDHPIEIQRN